MAEAPSTPSSLKPEQVEALVRRQASTPGGLSMDIVLTPALKPGPRSVSQPCSPLPLEARLEAAEARRTAIDHLRAANLSERLAKVEAVRSKKEELVVEKAARTKEEMEAKQEKVTEKRQAVVAETREKLSEHLARVERAQRDLEIQTEAYRLSTEFALNAKMMKVEENKDEQLEGMLARIQEHEAYVAKVRANQETRLRPYFAELETNIKEKLSIAEKRREEALGKVVDSAREEERKVEMVRRNKARLQEQGSGAGDTGPQSA